MLTRLASIVSLVSLVAWSAACSTTQTAQSKLDRVDQTSATSIASFKQGDPTLGPVLDQAAGYAIFPSVRAPGVDELGALWGRGELWAHGKRVGYCYLYADSNGAAPRTSKYMELIVFKDDLALVRFQCNGSDFRPNALAIAGDTGAAAQAKYTTNGVIVFTRAADGSMLQASIGGQSFAYESMAAAQESVRADRVEGSLMPP